MAVRVVVHGREVTVVLTGVEDVRGAAALRDAALGVVAAAPETCTVRLEGCEGLDTAALQVLLALHRALPGRVRFVGLPPAVTETWRLAGLDRLFGGDDGP
jgi:anti-anti-sigma regulatory factor